MKNAIAIFKGDLLKLRRNLIAWVIVLGLIVVPPLYAWFNISACWDPYGNTRELKIALANNDAGYEGQMFPININLGDTLLAKVRANDKFDWVITSEEDAIEGTKSGKYYASVVVPESFSADLMSMFSSNVHPSQLIYYVNEKENAIAPKITEKGAQGIQKEIEDNFAQEIMSIALATAKSLTDNGDMTAATNLMGNMLVTVRHTKDIVVAANASVKSLSYATSSMESLVKSVNTLADSIAQIAKSGKEISDDANSNIKELIGSVDAELAVIDKFIEDAQASGVEGLDNIIAELQKLRTDLNSMKSKLKSLKKNSDTVVKDLKQISKDINSISAKTSASLSSLRKALNNTSPLLDKAANDLESMAQEIEKGIELGDTEVLKDVLSQDTDLLSSFIASPVEVNRTALYHVENYGSAMAPFYTSLAIWVGATVLAALMSVYVEESRRKKLQNLRESQVYLGRYMIFAVIGLAQAGLICLGDLFFLGIQCVHPFLFMFAGLFASIVFGNIIYTLTATFGDIGKALAVIIMVIQVAGSGGTFPIEMMPKLFRLTYPLMPFKHSMTAMREAIAGTYGNTYWVALAYLAVYLIISLIIGIALHRPLKRANDAFVESLEKTKLM
ncbi:MAG: YhgE/Pip domain-containing protein [Clostridiales bacterium]|nr:YhgE/Pip domain-containing protein [Candidatus Crickella caballi]